MLIHDIKGACHKIEVMAGNSTSSLMAFDAPGSFRFFEGASYGLLTLTLMIPKGDIAPKIVVVFALVVGVSTMALSPFFDQADISNPSTRT
ncbi:hypothetical protein [Parasitella parasitica]|uniref:Uncharacterized protein n=1 Tax=Parasitella parasitica TaxID=35722 RepID=A0A0B7N2E4_9FUNG|nr:hypothetical protein [Parasitella parasitica]